MSPHGQIMPLRKKCKALDAIGLSVSTGLDVKIKLRRPLHVISSLADIASHQPALIDRWKTIPTKVRQAPLAHIRFNPRRGILQGTSFTATHTYMLALNPDIIKGKAKPVARIQQATASKRT